ncbi:MAG: transposase [Clostridiales bacterium]|jgi:DNA-directed RNA polymerase subunit RPC12/RpoP|nr:transposase [Clostridiales bacterium]
MKYNSLFDLYKAFPDEEACVKQLAELRWPGGIVCPHCGHTRKIQRIARDNIYKCADCKDKITVRSCSYKHNVSIHQWVKTHIYGVNIMRGEG